MTGIFWTRLPIVFSPLKETASFEDMREIILITAPYVRGKDARSIREFPRAVLGREPVRERMEAQPVAQVQKEPVRTIRSQEVRNSTAALPGKTVSRK